jgi:hypothetical protein
VERRTDSRDDRGTANHSSHRSSLVATVICAIATVLQQLSYCNCHLRHCLSLPTALKFVCPSVEKYSHNPIYKPTACYFASLPKLTRTTPRNPQKLLYTSVLTSMSQHRSPDAPLLPYPNTENTKTTKNISTPTEKSTTKMALTSWTEYHESLPKNEPSSESWEMHLV